MKKNVILFVLTLLAACSTDYLSSPADKFILPFITTLPPQRVSLEQATLSGFIEVIPLNTAEVRNGYSNEFQSKGFIWGEDENINLETSEKVILNSDVGPFSTEILSLKPATKYYFNTFVTDANNFSKLGLMQSFSTAEETPCDYDLDNYIQPIYDSYESLTIDNITLKEPSGFSDGTLEFETSTSSSIVSIRINLNEIDAELPLTGKYKGVYSFDNQSVKSYNEMKMNIIDYNGFIDFFPQGASSNPDTEFYIENNRGKITFIFCNTMIGDYILNGKFSYFIP